MQLFPIILNVPQEIQITKGRPKVQALSRLAREAAQQSAQKTLAHRLADFPKSADGVPQPVAGIHWSLSHKSAQVAGIVAPHPIGIDIEYHRPVKAGMAARIATPEEWRLAALSSDGAVDTPSERCFYRFWTAKEAVLKAVGQGLVGLSDCRVTALPSPRRMRLSHGQIHWEVVQRWYGPHLIALALPDDVMADAEICWPEMGRAENPAP